MSRLPQRSRLGPPSSASNHRRATQRDDTRLLLVWLGIFIVLLAGAAGLHALYRWTGPHPQVTAVIRRAKHHARWLIPGLKSRPHARPQAE